MEGGKKSGGDACSKKSDQQFYRESSRTQPQLEGLDWCAASML